MDNNITITPPSKPKKSWLSIKAQKKEKVSLAPPVAEKLKIIPEEKVEVLIKEIIRINPRDFSAFKHALEEFANEWDK